MASLIGKSFGRYQILEQLGEGGMALVYKAYDTRLERNVAIKIIRQEAFNPLMHEQVLKRFEREAKALAMLSHPNIVPVYDYGEYEGAPYLVMEYLPGGVLNLKRNTPIPWQEAVQILLPIAQALAYAHSHNIIHRDIKPSNILLTEQGVPMLSDFGIAKILESQENNTLTGAGMTIGTPEYMAPEQWSGKVGPQSDIYSLAVVLYELVTGRRPYTADTPVAIMLKQINDPLPRPTQFSPNLPEGLERVLFKALAKRPEDRYHSMAEFASALEKLGGGQTLPAVASLDAREENNTLQAYSVGRPQMDNATQLPGDGRQPFAAGIPSIPMPAAQPARASSRKTWLWAGIGGVLVFCVLATAIGIEILNPGKKKPPASPATVTAAVPSPLSVIPIPLGSLTPTNAAIPIAQTPTSTLVPTPSQITVLWDISHGPRFSSEGSPYTPDGLYKPLVLALTSQKFVFSNGGLASMDSFSILVLSATSADQRAYTSTEADQIEQFVRQGGHGLLIMSDIPGFENHLEDVSHRFGIDLGTTSSNGPVSYSKDPFFAGVSSLQFLFLSGVLQVSSPAVAAAWDQNGSPVVAYCECDAGRVMVVADSNLWDNRGFNQAGNAQFASNVFHWLARLSQ